MPHGSLGKVKTATFDDCDEEALDTSPHDDLVEAVLNGDEERARRLVATGADINALAADEYPPLCMAVEEMAVEEVHRLLAFGADPKLADPFEEQSPLAMAKRRYREMGFGRGAKQSVLLHAMMALAREETGRSADDSKARLEAIIALLEAAGK